MFSNGSRTSDHAHAKAAGECTHDHRLTATEAFDIEHRQDGSYEEANRPHATHDIRHAVIQSNLAEDNRRIVDDNVDAGGLVQKARRARKG